jgi:glycosyltransferase involved in cell wall biosynthesis
LTKQRFHVCFLNARFFPIGGTAIRTLNFARAVKNRGSTVRIITWQPTDSVEYRPKAQVFVLDGILVNSMPLGHRFLRRNFRFLYLLTLLLEFFKFVGATVEENNADVIHCANDTVWIGALLRTFVKKPIIADFHAEPFLPGLEVLPEQARSLQLFISKVALKVLDKSIDRYLTPTEELRDFLISWGLPSNKVIIIPNAVYLGEQKPRKSRSTIRSELNIEEGTIVIAFHGILLERYNIDALRNLSSISRIIQKNSQLKVKFMIIGFYDKVPPVNDESFIYTGYVEDLQEYLNAADFALVPIFEHSLGIRSRLLDYFIAALPVLTTSVGITGMSFAQDSGGVVVRNDVKELAASAIELGRSPEQLREMARKSRSLVNWFLPEKIGNDLKSLYAQVIQKKD